MKFIHHTACRYAGLLLLIVISSLLPPASAAQDAVVKNAWARAMAPGQTTASVYMEIVSGSDAVLVGGASERARSAELHAMHSEGGVMKMRAVSKLALPAQKTVKLAPGGVHLMLVGISRPLQDNERVPLELTIERAGGGRSTVRVEAEVRRLTGTAPAHAH